ncbi:hypothetical protein K4K51_005029 [Colletotrichum sp. SAR 10_75]|nr:hypothetical protein K4K51_005029 [Colletotrichum sp. SAR 10_75]
MQWAAMLNKSVVAGRISIYSSRNGLNHSIGKRESSVCNKWTAVSISVSRRNPLGDRRARNRPHTVPNIRRKQFADLEEFDLIERGQWDVPGPRRRQHVRGVKLDVYQKPFKYRVIRSFRRLLPQPEYFTHSEHINHKFSNATISASPSGNSSRPVTNLTDTVEGNSVVVLTVPTGYEPDVSCISTSDGAVPTTWSIVYTSTTTFYGDPADYTPPQPEITVPITCSPLGIGEGKSKSRIASGFTTCTDTSGCTAAALPSMVLTMSTPKIGPITTYTFVTTAKNPSVVYSPISTPRYGHDPETKAPQDKHTAVKPADKPTDNPRQPAPNDQKPPDSPTNQPQPAPDNQRPPDSPTSQPQSPPNDQRPPASTVPPRESVKEPPKATYTITVEPTKVIVNDQTFTVTNPSETRQVSVSGAEFTINPSEVVGGGTIVDRPGNVGRSTVAPSSTVVGDVPVVVAPDSLQNVVVVGGTTFELQATPAVTVVQGQTITIQSSGIVFPKQTVSINRSSPTQTEIVVAGGEMVTAIGPSVVIVHSTTFTYGLASSTITEIVDDDTILIGPSGVIVRNMTMGGPNATASDTAFEIVGGATITQRADSHSAVGAGTFGDENEWRPRCEAREEDSRSPT